MADLLVLTGYLLVLTGQEQVVLKLKKVQGGQPYFLLQTFLVSVGNRVSRTLPLYVVELGWLGFLWLVYRGSNSFSPWFDSQHSPQKIRGKISNVAEVKCQRWLEESGQWVKSGDGTHLVLVSGKPVLKNIQWQASFTNKTILYTDVKFVPFSIFSYGSGYDNLGQAGSKDFSSTYSAGNGAGKSSAGGSQGPNAAGIALCLILVDRLHDKGASGEVRLHHWAKFGTDFFYC